MRRSDTKALSGRSPVNNPRSHAVMTPEFFNGASTYRTSLDRHGMSLDVRKGSMTNPRMDRPGRYEKSMAEENDRPSDVSDAINTPPDERPGAGIEPNSVPSGQKLPGYGR